MDNKTILLEIEAHNILINFIGRKQPELREEINQFVGKKFLKDDLMPLKKVENILGPESFFTIKCLKEDIELSENSGFKYCFVQYYLDSETFKGENFGRVNYKIFAFAKDDKNREYEKKQFSHSMNFEIYKVFSDYPERGILSEAYDFENYTECNPSEALKTLIDNNEHIKVGRRLYNEIPYFLKQYADKL